jgi:N-acetylglucosaminyldiphosphoundecaprenol N-acetyl-beta-D-mannosaminyltransferase
MVLNQKPERPRIELQGIAFDAITESQACARIVDDLHRKRGGYIVTANLDHLLRCNKSQSYKSLVKQADLVVADGMPLIWASRLKGTPLPERVAGSTLCLSLAHALAEQGNSLFLLGGNPGVAEKAAQVLTERFPSLRIAGTYSPEFGFEKDPAQLEAIRYLLHDSQPDVVYVCLGSPKQEELIDRLRTDFPNVWWMGVGISLSFIAGEVPRAPLWVQRLGLEWIHRLAQEPRRLAKRYLVDGIPFAILLLTYSALQRLTCIR